MRLPLFLEVLRLLVCTFADSSLFLLLNHPICVFAIERNLEREKVVHKLYAHIRITASTTKGLSVPPYLPTHRMSTTHRIKALSNHLSTPPNLSPQQTTMSTTTAAEKKPPITCHVLDTTLGRPGANIPVTLTLHSSTSSTSPSSTAPKFTGTTNADGRITTWTPSTPFSSASLASVFSEAGDQKWSLTFDTAAYFAERGIETFFPEVEVKFLVREAAKGEHFHVPVLLGPFGYTTYRGS
jgi:5-hydroxyisourate hydrolase